MKFRKINSDYVIKMDKGDDIVKEITELCKKENIKGACFTGIGAISYAKLGWFNPVTKEYHTKDIDEYVEITSLVGNVGRLDNDDPLVHTHITLSDSNFNVRAGHLFQCKVSLAAEIFLKDLGEELRKAPDLEFHLNFLKL
jgi:predicted DNA-binding protein with PD1-like motif